MKAAINRFSLLRSFVYILIAGSGLFFFKQEAIGQTHTNERAAWFVDARFGMFIHWGVYSGAEGFWKGEKIRYDNNYAEWIQYRNRIDKEEYLSLLNRFEWDEINPEQWVILAKRAGMKYVTITAKHHDGFALWDSKVSGYDVGDFTLHKRDIIRELAAACQKHGLKLGLYYSHWVDWEHPYGWDHTKEVYHFDPAMFDLYWQQKVIPQMRELLTDYGPIGIIWFDMWIHHSGTVVTKEQLLQLKGLIRELQPDCLVNSRLGLSVEEDPDVDFQTLGDNQFGTRKLDYPWQSPATVAHSWGYHASDTEWKSTSTLLKYLINNVSLNGNMMLNIGPRANGEVAFEISQRLLEMGRWLEINGESIYGSGAFDLRKDLHDWGLITSKETLDGKFRLYLHVMNWPLQKQLKVTGIKASPASIYILSDKLRSPLYFKHQEVVTTIELPQMAPDPFITVVVMEYDQKPDIADGLVAASTAGGSLLTPKNFVESEGNSIPDRASRFGSVPEHIVVTEHSKYQWKIFVEEPGNIDLDVSYSFQSEERRGRIEIQIAGTVLTHTLQPTGKTVGEPRQDWVIDNYGSHRIGSVYISKSGFYDVTLEIVPDENHPIDFQWVWLEKE